MIVARLLVVEDDLTIGDLLARGLQSHGHDTRWERSGKGALRSAHSTTFDLILVDLGLPDFDGLELCRQLRTAQPPCVLVILTARDREMDVVLGLETGADDYLTKPFRYGELLARIRAHLRRAAPSEEQQHVLTVGDLRVDIAARQCSLLDRQVPLRTKEFDLLARLASQPGIAVSRQTLMSDVWDENWSGPTKTLDVHVAALRRKLMSGAGSGTRGRACVPNIVTLRGYGYRLENPGADC